MLLGAAAVGDSVYLLMDGQLARLDRRTGAVLGSVTLDYTAEELLAVGGELFVSAAIVPRERLSSVFMYSPSLVFGRSFHAYDRRLDRFHVGSVLGMASNGQVIHVVDALALRLDGYTTDGDLLYSYRLPPCANDLDVTLGRSDAGMSQPERLAAREGLHRFDWVTSFGQSVVFREHGHGSKISRWWRFTEDDRALRELSGLKLLVGEEGGDRAFTFDAIAGSYREGILAVLADDDRFNRFRSQHRALATIKFDAATANPLLCFLRLTRNGRIL